MMTERTAAYLLAAVCALQTVHPSCSVKTHGWRSIDVQIGRLRVKASRETGSIGFEGLETQRACGSAVPQLQLGSKQRQAEKLQICANDSSCLTAWSDGTWHAWLISRDKI